MAAKKSAQKKSAAKQSAATKSRPAKAAPTPSSKAVGVKRPVMKTMRGTPSAAVRTTTKKPPQSMPYEQGKWAHAFAPRASGERRYWLVKSEPDVFSFSDLQHAPAHTTCWDSVRNTAARNFMRDGMKLGDLVFYYHSNAEPSAIVGICEVVREGYPDHTAFDPAHAYYDPDSVRDTPTWFMVDVKAVEPLARPVTLPEIKGTPALAEMALLKVSRLSVVPIAKSEWELVLRMSQSTA
jgi:predicted RNA-binding protein with PUA-like domain